MSGYRGALVRADTPDEREARAALGGFLLEGEELTWLGRPRIRLADRNRLGRNVIITYGVAVAFIATLGQGLSVVRSVLIALVLTLACVYGASLVRRRGERIRSRLFYGLTRRRILIVDPTASPIVTALDLATLPGLFLQDENAEGDATIYLDPRSIPKREGDKLRVDPAAPPPLLMIPNARLIYEQILDARSALPPPSAELMSDARTAPGGT